MFGRYKPLDNTYSTTNTYSPYEELWNFDDIFESTKPELHQLTPVSQGSVDFDSQSSSSSNLISLASTATSFDKIDCDWNRPMSRNPISDSMRDVFCAETANFTPSNSLGSIDHTPPDLVPHSNQSLRSYVHNSCFCELCEMMREFDRAYQNEFNYSAVRKDFESNGKDVTLHGEDIEMTEKEALQFTPEKDKCSTPFMIRKPLTDINNNMQYFDPQFSPIKEVEEISQLDCNVINENNYLLFGDPSPVQVSKSNGKKKQNNVELAVNYCVFCLNNHEHELVYKSHTVKDAKGRVLCPRLRIYVCPICGKDGDEAHTTKYCKQRKTITPADTQKWVADQQKREMERNKKRPLRTMIF